VTGDGSFEVVGSTTIADVGFVSLSQVRVEGHNQVLSRHVVHHPGAVVVVPVEPDRRTIVMVRQFRAATARDLLEVPAGKRDVEREAPEETAVRELVEEIGRRPGRLVPLCEFYNSPGFCDEYTHLYAAFDLETVDRAAATAEEEFMTVERITLDDIDSLIASRAIVDAKSIIGLQLTRRYLAGEYEGLH
jgi:ADP-ribose pyrophosphatase